MVLAIALRIQISHPGLAEEDATTHVQSSWLYFQNAASVMTELLLKNTDLVSIQAILGMVRFVPPFFWLVGRVAYGA